MTYYVFGRTLNLAQSINLFWKKMLWSGNLILFRLAKCRVASIFALAAKYHIEPHHVVRSSVTRMKDSFWFYFSELE